MGLAEHTYANEDDKAVLCLDTDEIKRSPIDQRAARRTDTLRIAKRGISIGRKELKRVPFLHGYRHLDLNNDKFLSYMKMQI